MKFRLSLLTAVCCFNISTSLIAQTSVWTWGNNQYGQLGNGTFAPPTGNPANPYPTPINNFSNVAAIAAGDYHSLAVMNDGTVFAWGWGYDGELGTGSFMQTGNQGLDSPNMIGGISNVVAVAAGARHSAALKSDGTVWTWGNNSFGQLAHNYPTSYPYPVPVIGLTNVVAISAGSYFTLALKRDGTVWGWGDNSKGELGDGTFISRTTPVQMLNVTNATSIAAGGSHSIIIKLNNSVWVCGENASGQLGQGYFSTTAPTGVNVPVQVSGFSDAYYAAGGVNSTYILRSNGMLWSWGNNHYGQLGQGFFTGSPNFATNTPAQTVNLTNVVSIGKVLFQGAAVKVDGTAQTWGNNSNGEVGNGSFSNISTPHPAYDISNVAYLTGGNHTMAIVGNAPITMTGVIHLQNWVGTGFPNTYVSIDSKPPFPVAIANNTFTISLSVGSHTIKIQSLGFLPQRLAILASSSAPTMNFFGPSNNGLIAGDTNNDNKIDDTDLLNVINHFLQSGTNNIGNTNGDNIVDDSDLLNVINNFLDVGDV